MLACANATRDEKITYDVVAGQEYTVLLKGAGVGEAGNYNLKLYDELGLSSAVGGLLECKTICPNIAPYNCKGVGVTASSSSDCCSGSRSSGRCSTTTSLGFQGTCKGVTVTAATDVESCSGARQSNGTCTNAQCASSEINASISRALTFESHYVTVKGRGPADKGFYEVQIGNPSDGASQTRYVPPTWQEVADAVTNTGVKVLPVLSCPPGGNDGRCAGTELQARALSKLSGAVEPDPMTAGATRGIAKYINENGTGIGSGLALAVRDLANYLSMDISLVDEGNPGFTVEIQKCTDITNTAQRAVCGTDPRATPRAASRRASCRGRRSTTAARERSRSSRSRSATRSLTSGSSHRL
jgi:hypothetical protein